jgi:hypothetical protein
MKSAITQGLERQLWLGPLLAAIVVLSPTSVYAQQTATPDQAKPIAPLPTIQNLKVVALAGKGGMNDLDHRVMAPLVVQILDSNDRPVEGADVVFRFPLTGPSATFADQSSSRTVKSNGVGQAAAMGWTANGEVGNFEVHVSASYGNESGETNVSMINVTRIVNQGKQGAPQAGKSWWSSPWAKAGVIGGGAALAAILAIVLTRGSSSHPTPTPVPPLPPVIVVTPGPPVFGGPQ